MEVSKQLELILKSLESKQGKDILTLNVEGKTSLCDYFVIVSGSSTPQVKALAEAVDEEMSKNGVEKKRMEGISEGRWVVMDYGDIIVHIFHDQTRLFYHLERLWQTESKSVIE